MKSCIIQICSPVNNWKTGTFVIRFDLDASSAGWLLCTDGIRTNGGAEQRATIFRNRHQREVKWRVCGEHCALCRFIYVLNSRRSNRDLSTRASITFSSFFLTIFYAFAAVSCSTSSISHTHTEYNITSDELYGAYKERGKPYISGEKRSTGPGRRNPKTRTIETLFFHYYSSTLSLPLRHPLSGSPSFSLLFPGRTCVSHPPAPAR